MVIAAGSPEQVREFIFQQARRGIAVGVVVGTCVAYAEKIGSALNGIDFPVVLYDTVTMDYVSLDELYTVKGDGSPIPFEEAYREELKYLYPGEIILYTNIEE